ncbi:transposable element Tc1 transposase [Trichonephila clavipes]|nr:transposable element Tc1 transposase [Trichonephila clavipes]
MCSLDLKWSSTHQKITCFRRSCKILSCDSGIRFIHLNFHSDVSLEVVDQRAENNSKNWQWKTEGDVSTRRSTPAPHGGERPCSFLQSVGNTLIYCYRCTNVGFVNSSTSAAPWIACKVPLYKIPLTAHLRRLRLQWADEHRAWQANWLQVVFSDESLFNLWNHDGCIRVRRYAGERCLLECVIERNNGLTTGVMVWDAISYHRRSNLLRIEGNLNSNRYVREVLHPEVVPFLQSIPGAIFQQHNTRPHVAKTVRDFCSAQHMQLLPWPAYSPVMSPIEHVGWSAYRS